MTFKETKGIEIYVIKDWKPNTNKKSDPFITKMIYDLKRELNV